MRTSRVSFSPSRAAGFTLIEMVVVMATIGLLLALALPRYLATLERGKEQVLRQNIAQMRDALDKFYGDTGKYPDRLEDLVTRRYLRAIPVDPFTETATWVVLAPKDPAMGGVLDVQSTFTDLDGKPRLGAGTAPPAEGSATEPLAPTASGNVLTNGSTDEQSNTPAAAPPADMSPMVAREAGTARTVAVQPAPPASEPTR